MDTISNEVFLAAKENIDNKKLIKSILNKYSKIFPWPELINMGDIALWNCLLQHKDNMGQKFTTSLYRHVVWQILIELRKFNKDNQYSHGTVSSGVCVVDNKGIGTVEMMDALNTLEPKFKNVVYEYYIENRTLSEISKRHGIVIETARKRIQKGLEILKDKCN